MFVLHFVIAFPLPEKCSFKKKKILPLFLCELPKGLCFVWFCFVFPFNLYVKRTLFQRQHLLIQKVCPHGGWAITVTWKKSPFPQPPFYHT